MLGCLQEPTSPGELIGRTAYLPVQYWCISSPSLDCTWMVKEAVGQKEFQKKIKNRAGENTKSYLFFLSLLTENLCKAV